MKIKIVILMLCILLTVSIASCKTNKEQFLTDEEIALVRTEIIEWRGFDPAATAWGEIEKIKHENGDAYIFHCIVEQEELYWYTFAVKIEYYAGKIDIDVWQVHGKARESNEGKRIQANV